MAETAVGPIRFLINMFTAFKWSQFYFYLYIYFINNKFEYKLCAKKKNIFNKRISSTINNLQCRVLILQF